MAKVTIEYGDGSSVVGEVDDLDIMTHFAEYVIDGTDHYYLSTGEEI